MDNLLRAIDKLKGKIGNKPILIDGNPINRSEIYSYCYDLGIKRKYKDVSEYYFESRYFKTQKSLQVSLDCLKQWQTVAYYSLLSSVFLDKKVISKYYLDLDLLVTNDNTYIDDMHYSVALLQIPDLPYDYIERIEYKVEKDGRYDRYISNIVDYIRKKIDEECYVAIILDDFYIKNVATHSVLRSFVYGYDDFNEEFLCLGFNGRVFEKYRVKYTSMIEGFEYGKLLNFQAPVYMEVYKPIDMKLNKKVENFDIKEKIKSYFLSLNNYDRLQGEEKKGRWSNCKEYVGYQASEMFVETLKKMCDGNAEVCYEAIHAFYEHKQVLYSRVNESQKFVSSELLFESAMKANIARLLFLKWNENRDRSVLVKCVSYCCKVLECEQQFYRCNIW